LKTRPYELLSRDLVNYFVFFNHHLSLIHLTPPKVIADYLHGTSMASCHYKPVLEKEMQLRLKFSRDLL